MAGDARRFTLLPRGGFTREYEYGSGPDKILVRDNDTGREFMVDPYGEQGTDTLPGGLRVLGIHRVEGARLVPGSGVSVPGYRLAVVPGNDLNAKITFVGDEPRDGGAPGGGGSRRRESPTGLIGVPDGRPIGGGPTSSAGGPIGASGLGRIIRQIQERVPEEGRAAAMDGVVAASGLGASPGTLELVATRDLPGGHAVVFGHADGHIAYYPEDGKTKKFNPGEYEEMTSG